MAIVAELSSKAERIEIRVTPNVKALLTAAAQERHTSVSEFVVLSSRPRPRNKSNAL